MICCFHGVGLLATCQAAIDAVIMMRLDQMRLDLRRLPDLTTCAVTMSLCIVLKQRDDEQDSTVGHFRDVIAHNRDLHMRAFRHGQEPM